MRPLKSCHSWGTSTDSACPGEVLTHRSKSAPCKQAISGTRAWASNPDFAEVVTSQWIGLPGNDPFVFGAEFAKSVQHPSANNEHGCRTNGSADEPGRIAHFSSAAGCHSCSPP